MGLSVAEGWDKVEIGMEDESSYSENFCELCLSLIYIEQCVPIISPSLFHFVLCACLLISTTTTKT